MSQLPASKSRQRLHGALSTLKRTGAKLAKLKPPKPDPVAAVSTLRRRHQARRMATGLRFALADRIDFLNAADWDTLASQTVFLSRDYLRVLERHAPSNIE